MPSYVIPAKCTGCGDCVNICPSHIMKFTKSGVFGRKAVNIEPESCWECYNCVKHCPQGAVQIRGYVDFTPLGGSVEVYRDEKTNRVYWTIRYRNGNIKHFVFPIRTKPWNSIKPPNEYPEPPKEFLRTPYLSLEHEKLGGNKLGVELPTYKVPEVIKVEVR